MNKHHPRGRTTTSFLLPAGLVLVLVLVLVFMGIRYKDRSPVLQDFTGNMAKKMAFLSGMRANLFNSEQAEKSAVMADTDEASLEFAEQSRRATDFVERDRLEFKSLLDRDHMDKELKLFQEFDSCWTELRKIDQVILEFAVQNTNLKAAALSFTQGRDAMNRFEHALKTLIHHDASSEQDSRVMVLASNALWAGLHAHNLHAPHIVEARDEKMDEIEAEMRTNAETIDASLRELSDLVSDEGRASLQEAKAAYDDFAGVTAEVVRLSRRNTNVKSFALSLGRKRKIAAQCDEILIGLQETVRSREFKATR
jgi:hypothetical protein